MAESPGNLATRLSSTNGIAACAQLVCDHLVALGYPLPSLYLCRSGRLRCFGASGYSQVLDGFPPVAGVISATVRTGRPHVVDVAQSLVYLKAAPSVVAEICVPIDVDGETIGALNIESQHPLGPETVRVAGECAELFARRLTELGGLPEPTGWMYLADQAARVVQIEEVDRLYETALDIAGELSGADSGMIAIGDTTLGFTLVAARGSLLPELQALSAHSLHEIGRSVDGPLACYTSGAADGEWFIGFDRMREAGLGTLIVLALVRGSQQLGFYAVADRTSSTPSTELVEQLELLGSIVSSALSNAHHVAALRELARRDPLTGLGHNAAFGERLEALRSHGRSHAVLAIDVDHFKSVNDTHGHEHGNQVLRTLAEHLAAAIRADDALFRTGGDEFAAVLPVRNVDEALQAAARMEEAARRLGTPVSIGVAFNEDGDDDLYLRADAALYSAKRQGRNVTVLAGAPSPADG